MVCKTNQTFRTHMQAFEIGTLRKSKGSVCLRERAVVRFQNQVFRIERFRIRWVKWSIQ